MRDADTGTHYLEPPFTRAQLPAYAGSSNLRPFAAASDTGFGPLEFLDLSPITGYDFSNMQEPIRSAPTEYYGQQDMIFDMDVPPAVRNTSNFGQYYDLDPVFGEHIFGQKTLGMPLTTESTALVNVKPRTEQIVVANVHAADFLALCKLIGGPFVLMLNDKY